MLKIKWSILCILGALLIASAAQADFTMTDPNTESGGSGLSSSSAVMTNAAPTHNSWDDTSFYDGWDNIPEAGWFDYQNVAPSAGAIVSYQDAYGWAIDGSASASTGGTLANTGSGVNAGDTVEVSTSGGTSADVQREVGGGGDIDDDQNVAWARLVAVGGGGSITTDPEDGRSLVPSTEDGVMMTLGHTWVISHGFRHGGEGVTGTDTIATTSGSANVNYRFAGAPASETVSIENADIRSTGDIYDDAWNGYSSVEGNSWALGLVGWTDNLEGQTFTGQTGISSEVYLDREEDDRRVVDDLNADAQAAGTVDLAFTYRPNPIFSLIGNANGSTAANGLITLDSNEDNNNDDEAGEIIAVAGKHSIGYAGTANDAQPLALSWLHATLLLDSDENRFDAEGHAEAVNPAVLGETEFDPDPSMTVTTQYGTYAASMGSSSLTNSQVVVDAVTENMDENNEGENDEILATAFGFAQAAADRTMSMDLGSENLFSLSTGNAFVGVGSIVIADEDDDRRPEWLPPLSATANAYNLYGTASTPSYSGAVNNGHSSASVIADEDGLYERANSAGADLVTGTNYPIVIGHNQLNGTLQYQGVPWLETYWVDYLSSPLPYPGDGDHVTGAFIGGGGN